MSSTSTILKNIREIRIPRKFHQNLAEKKQFWWKFGLTFGSIQYSISQKVSTIFDKKIEFGAVQKYDNLVDLEKCFPKSIYLQKLASIQPRTSLSKFDKISQKSE